MRKTRIFGDKKEKKMPYKNLALCKTIHPETGEISLLSTLKYVITKLNESSDLQSDGLIFHRMSGGMRKQLEKIGIPAKYLADMLLLMQNIGLLRKQGGGKLVLWEIVDSTMIDEFLTEASMHAGLLRLKRHLDVYIKCTALSNKLEILQKGNKSGLTETDSKQAEKHLLEQIAMCVAKYETLRDAYTQQAAELGALKKAQEESVKPTAADIAAEMMKNIS